MPGAGARCFIRLWKIQNVNFAGTDTRKRAIYVPFRIPLYHALVRCSRLPNFSKLLCLPCPQGRRTLEGANWCGHQVYSPGIGRLNRASPNEQTLRPSADCSGRLPLCQLSRRCFGSEFSCKLQVPLSPEPPQRCTNPI